MSTDEFVQVAVIGAGQAGLAVSRRLSDAGTDHVVLERGRIGETWRSQRWDSFRLNTPNWSSALAAMEFRPDEPDAFSDADELTEYLERYADEFDLPIHENTEVVGLARDDSGAYVLNTTTGTIRARAVVLASGSMSRPRVPDMAADLPDDVASLSAGSYRNPDDLPGGAVLVVGSAQSGCQIAEDLLRAGRKVYLCASRVGRIPRTYRGRDIFRWLGEMQFFEARPEDLEDPAMQYMAQPQVSGTRGGHTVSLQSLARDGATLLGRLEDVDGSVVRLGDDLRECIAFADQVSTMIKQAVDRYIERTGIDAEPATPDPGEPDLPDLDGSDTPDELDLRDAGVSAVVWCTGFDADWSWIDTELLDDQGEPRHEEGIGDIPGFYVCGFPWISKRKSGLIFGVPEDAERIVRHLETYLDAA